MNDLGEDGLERADVRELDVGRRAAVGEVRQPRLQEGHNLRTRGRGGGSGALFGGSCFPWKL